MPSSDSSRDALLEQLAEEFVERYRRGERPALTEFIDRCPDLAAEIRELFPALVQIENLKPEAGDLTGAFVPTNTPPDEQIPERFGEYRILREVGHGGMGIVYEAEQESLGRHVALKVLPRQALLKGTYLERFRREAKAAGRLHHTNIVPVFGVGECDGTHYYVMQFIPGEGLDKVLGDLRQLRASPATRTGLTHLAEASMAHILLTGQFVAPPTDAPEAPAANLAPSSPTSAEKAHGSSTLSTGGSESQYFRGVARIALQAADALAYAHRQGILHRDIKPSNLLLDQQGTVWITDFGLAKAEGADDLTQAGDIVGTVRNMAPERFEGRSLPQSDVYALGVTMYELLTLRSAFEDGNKARLVDKVLHDPPVPPRKIDPHIPRDLETVVLKCLAKDPAERYASAEALAEDVGRFLADRPIRARRSTVAEQAWRWCRRNRGWAAMVAAVALLVTVIAVGGVIMSLSLRFALKESEGERVKVSNAERSQREQTLEALMAEARARRFSGRVGQRFAAIDAVRKAVTLARELDKPAAAFDELRNLAVAALALPDFRENAKTWEGWPEGSSGLDFDPVALRMYARGDLEGNVSVRRLEDDTEVARLNGLGKPRGIVFGADGKTLLLHDSESGVLERWTIGGPAPERVATIAKDVCLWQQSRDGRRLLALHQSAKGRRAEVLDLPSGRRCFEHSSSAHDDHSTRWRAALSPDGRWLALGDGSYVAPNGNRVLLFDLDTAKPAGVLSNPGTAFSLAWHPDSRTLAVSEWNAGWVYIWDAPSGKLLHTLTDRKGGEPIIGMSQSGQLLTSMSCWAGGQFFWHPHTEKPMLRTPFWYSVASTLQDGRLYEVAIDKTRITLRVAEPSPILRTFVPDPATVRTNGCSGVSIHPNGRLLAVGHWTDVSLFDLPTGVEVARLNLGPNPLVRFDPSNGDLLTYGPRGLFRWLISFAPGLTGAVTVGPPRLLAPGSSTAGDWQFDVSRDGKVILVADRTRTFIYRQEAARLRALLLGPLRDCRVVRLSPDGQWALTTENMQDERLIWDTRTGRRVAKVASSSTPFFGKDGCWLTDGRRRWRIGTWQEEPMTVPEGSTALIFSENDVMFAGQTSDETIHIVNAATGRTLVQLGLSEQCRFWCATFSPDGTQFIHSSQDQHSVYAWDLRELRCQLSDLGLDWNAPPFPPASENTRQLPPVVTVKPIDPSQVPEAAVESVDPFLWVNRGREFVKSGQWDKVAANYVKAMELLPEDSEYTSYRNRICYALACREEVFAKAIALRPGDIGLRLARARYHVRKGEWEKAAASYAMAIASPAAQDYDLHVFVEWACTQILAGDGKGYGATCARFHEHFRRTDDPLTAYLLGRAYVLGPISGISPPIPVKLVEQALAGKLPDKNFQAASLHVLGLAHYRAGQFEEAVRHCRQSLSTSPEWIGLSLNWPVLALAHQQLGNQDEARKWLEKTRKRLEEVAQEIAKEPVGSPTKVHPTDLLELQVLHREAEALLREGSTGQKK
jgi:serine/threonine protein kinase/WD40 repeat protein/tetratricopeptide (TPR) repeat protein